MNKFLILIIIIQFEAIILLSDIGGKASSLETTKSSRQHSPLQGGLQDILSATDTERCSKSDRLCSLKQDGFRCYQKAGILLPNSVLGKPRDNIAEPEPITKTLIVRSYCPCVKCCGRNADGKTCKGRRIRLLDLTVAADLSVFPIGTKMFIQGYGKNGRWAVVRDTGPRCKGNKIEVLMTIGKDPHQRALNWGRKVLRVKIWRSK